MKKSPPKFPLRFFRWFCNPDFVEDLEGDLLERFEKRVEEKSIRSARWGFTKDVIMLFRPGIIKPITTTQKLTQYDMFKNYYKIGIRNILKYKLFSFINIFGLAVAMSVCLLIILMLADQYQYDQFHTKKERIYRIQTAHTDGNITAATTPFPTLEAFNSDYELAEKTTSLRRGVGGDAVHQNNFTELIGYFADPNFFKVFSYELSKGNPATALVKPNSMIISEEAALKLFGNENPLGKTIDFTNRGLDFDDDESGSPDFWGTYTITGVIPIDSYKTHLSFDVLISQSTLNSLYQQEKVYDLSESWTDYYRTYNYVLLKENYSKVDLASALVNLSNTKFLSLEDMKVSYLIPENITDFRPGPLLNNPPSVSLPLFVYYILSGLALLVLLLACLNYTNLSVARAITRTKEIGIRKVTGAHRNDLIFQFLSESIITAFFALILAIIILYFIKSAFEGLWVNQYLNFELSTNLYVYCTFFLFTILLGILAGLFPAFKLSKQRPAMAMKGLTSLDQNKMSLRKALTVSQFAISLLFIITSIVIYNQFKHFMHFDYGFRTENVMNVNLQSNDFEKIRLAFSSVKGVESISGSEYLPSTGRTENMVFEIEGKEKLTSVIAISASTEYIDVLDFKVIAGDLIRHPLSDDGLTMVINREAVESFGYVSPAEIIGESLENDRGEYLRVVAVIENFTFHLLFNGRSNSSVLIYNKPARFTMANIFLNKESKPQIISDLSEAWKKIDAAHPFNFEFYDDSLSGNNKGIFDIVSVVGFIAFLAISIASLGLLGMVIYTTERKTKEVGIRKILGAKNSNLAYLLSKEFLKLIAISIIIASPLAYLFNNFWLDFMTTRVNFGLGTVLLGSFILLAIGLLTIGSQTLKASKSNPTTLLRNE
uniref:FtsX-like permease family protein n=1 Tax=Fulvivirga sp. TaxID=1931237 RepID=UPI00404B6319